MDNTTGILARMRLGAYILPGDTVWLRSSLMQYYDRIDDLVVLVPRSHCGWRGTPIPVDECLAIVKAVDVRGIARLVEGEWCDPEDPLRADTAQRLDGVRALRDTVDWILQIDNDEVLMDPAALMAFVEEADRAGEVQVDWPLRTLFRQVAPATYLEVCSLTGETVVEYAPVAVRAGHDVVEVRRALGPVLRVVVEGDDRSLLIRRPAVPGERRVTGLQESQTILHNSWGRTPAEVWRKTRSWGHYSGLKGIAYYVRVWWPARWTWRWMRDFHPFSQGLWPRLRPFRVPPDLLQGADDR